MFDKCFLSFKKKSWLNLTSSSLILSNCSEWTARAWKGSWLATVESQGCTFENVRNIDISQFMQNCAPLPTQPNHPPPPPPCQLSPWKIFNLTHLFVFSRLIINTGGIHIEKHYIRCEILTTLRHFESNLILEDLGIEKGVQRSVLPEFHIRQCFLFLLPCVCQYHGL